MLLDRDGVVCTSLVREVVCKDHALSSVHHANPSNDVTRGNIFVEAGQLAKS